MVMFRLDNPTTVGVRVVTSVKLFKGYQVIIDYQFFFVGFDFSFSSLSVVDNEKKNRK